MSCQTRNKQYSQRIDHKRRKREEHIQSQNICKNAAALLLIVLHCGNLPYAQQSDAHRGKEQEVAHRIVYEIDKADTLRTEDA